MTRFLIFYRFITFFFTGAIVLFNKKVISLIIGSLLWLPQFAFSAEVNILSERQEFLLRPFLTSLKKIVASKRTWFISKKARLSD